MGEEMDCNAQETVERYSAMVYRLAYAKTGNKADAGGAFSTSSQLTEGNWPVMFPLEQGL